jgi:hypothetical protein
MFKQLSIRNNKIDELPISLSLRERELSNGKFRRLVTANGAIRQT